MVEAAENPNFIFQVEPTSGLTRSKAERFKSVMVAEYSNQSQSTSNTKIGKVPIMLQDIKDFEKIFVPLVVSIGPYHHGNVKYQQAEMIKLKFTMEFNNGNQQQMEAMYDAILKDIKKLRDFYDDEPTKDYNDDALAWMLFVDGCWVLHWIYCFVNDELDKHMIRARDVAFVHQDLFLLENQLPFRVLNLLINEKYGTTASSAAGNEKKVGIKMIEDFIQEKIGQRGCGSSDLTEEHSHLLDLLRKRLVGCTNQQKSERTGLIFKRSTFRSNVSDRTFRRNVSDLRAVWIYLKPSDTNSLTDVSFISQLFTGVLKLPRIIVDNSTGSMFLNLIAYEMSPGFENNMEVTSYICFLDSLIDLPDDVKQLRAAGILYNLLGSDQEVADLFNDIGTDLVPNDQIYEQVKSDIQNHYNSEKRIAMAQFYQTYFGTPWTFLASVWGLIAIFLTAITSFFTIFPLKDECSVLCKKLIKSPHI